MHPWLLRPSSSCAITVTACVLPALQVFVGRQHLLSIELDGVEYKVIT